MSDIRYFNFGASNVFVLAINLEFIFYVLPIPDVHFCQGCNCLSLVVSETLAGNFCVLHFVYGSQC